MTDLGPTFPGEPHCVYCALPVTHGQVCAGHNDLRDDLEQWQMRHWWQARYTPAEIAELAEAVA